MIGINTMGAHAHAHEHDGALASSRDDRDKKPSCAVFEQTEMRCIRQINIAPVYHRVN